MKKLLTLLLLASVGFNAQAQLVSGSTAPDFTATDINGRTWRLYDILESGRPVVMDVSATWCGPCWNFHNGGSLENYYAAHGPEGDGKSMVFFVEGDGATNLNCLYGASGCVGGTQGNWVAGTPYPIFDNSDIANLYAIAYFPTVYLITPDKKVSEVGQLSTANLWAKASPNVGNIPANWGKISTMNAGARTLEYCGGQTLFPSIDVTNLGTSPITSMSIELRWNGVPVQNQDFTGDIKVLDAQAILFDAFDISTAGTLVAEVTSINGQANGNNAIYTIDISPAPEKYTGDKVEIRVRTDANGKDIYWAVFDDNGNLFDEGGNSAVGLTGGGVYPNGAPAGAGAYNNNATIKDTITVPGACFSFILVDGRGDGLVPPGNVKVLGMNAVSFQSFVGNFGEKVSRAFAETTSGVIAPSAVSELEITPNPASESLSIAYELAVSSELSLSVVNAIGQTVVERAGQLIPAGTQRMVIPVSQLANGVYYLRIQTAQGGLVAKQFVVVH